MELGGEVIELLLQRCDGVGEVGSTASTRHVSKSPEAMVLGVDVRRIASIIQPLLLLLQSREPIPKLIQRPRNMTILRIAIEVETLSPLALQQRELDVVSQQVELIRVGHDGADNQASERAMGVSSLIQNKRGREGNGLVRLPRNDGTGQGWEILRVVRSIAMMLGVFASYRTGYSARLQRRGDDGPEVDRDGLCAKNLYSELARYFLSNCTPEASRSFQDGNCLFRSFASSMGGLELQQHYAVDWQFCWITSSLSSSIVHRTIHA